MVGMPIALLGHNHVCPKVEIINGVPVPHVGGPIISTKQQFVTVYGVPVATVSDKAICTGAGKIDEIQGGSSVATILNKKIARAGDRLQHGGAVTQGINWITSI